MHGDEIDIALRLLDDQLIDADGRRCGRVDDVELRGGPGGPTTIAALLTGAGAWPHRVPRRLAPVFRIVSPPYTHRIPWEAVEDFATTVKLSHTRQALGLGSDDGRNVRWNGSPARESLLVSTLLGATAVTTSGATLGRVGDVRVERRRPDTLERPWIVTGLLVGTRGLLERFGAPAGRHAGPPPFLAWERVLDLGDGLVRVSDHA